ncbi:MAG TPA: serine dehydratase [Clostridiaceae bacterium]|nr:serine dehydratase [Clostridiaceae bacterium]
MRGASSSHTAAAVRIGQILQQLRGTGKTKVDFYFQAGSSLAQTYHSQQSDLGLAAGLLGLETDDRRLLSAMTLLPAANLEVNFHITPAESDHPNAYQACLQNEDGSQYKLTFLSTGGGMIELTRFQGKSLSEDGGFYLALLSNPDLDLRQSIKEPRGYVLASEPEQMNRDSHSPIARRLTSHTEDFDWLLIRSDREFTTKEKAEFELKASEVIYLIPVLTINSQLVPEVPFTSVAELQRLAKDRELNAFQAALLYESGRSGLPASTLQNMMESILTIMEEAIDQGLAGTEFSDRILGPQASKILANSQSFVGGEMLQNIIANTCAVMEMKSSLGVIVAAPTAGACGVIPGTLLSVAKTIDADRDTVIEALFVAGLIGLFIALESTFSAELAGCQAECGSASGMAAGAIAYMLGGDLDTVLSAASLALQNIIGLVCDPVAGRVEVPCLGKNILAGHNALSCANMAVSGFDPVIPLEETIKAMDEAGRMLPAALRCTAQGGLATTETSRRIEQMLDKQKEAN